MHNEIEWGFFPEQIMSKNRAGNINLIFENVYK